MWLWWLTMADLRIPCYSWLISGMRVKGGGVLRQGAVGVGMLPSGRRRWRPLVWWPTWRRPFFTGCGSGAALPGSARGGHDGVCWWRLCSRSTWLEAACSAGPVSFSVEVCCVLWPTRCWFELLVFLGRWPLRGVGGPEMVCLAMLLPSSSGRLCAPSSGWIRLDPICGGLNLTMGCDGAAMVPCG
ncbi:hypothetical protein D1007_04814 [Hordeum vulgare]|nr:hypothetical protein D1007_04814 [Hordeum vulgare]